MAEEKSPTEFWVSLFTLVLASIVTVASSVFIVTSTMKINKIDTEFDDPEAPDNLVRLRTEADARRQERDRNRQLLVDYFRPLGVEPPIALMEPAPMEPDPRFHSTIDPDDVSTGVVAETPLLVYLDHWQRELQERYGVTFGRWADGDDNALTFQALFQTLEQQLTDARNRADAAQGTARTTWDNYMTARRTTQTAMDAQLTQITADDGLIQGMRQVLQRLATEPAQRWSEVVDLDRRERAARQALQDETHRTQEERTALTAVAEELREKIEHEEHLRALAQERQDPDGRVLRVDAEHEIVYVDLTRADRVFPGMRFRVYRVEPGAVRVLKGEIQIYDIGDTMSRGYVTHRDPGTPELWEGDLIFNVQFERGRPFTIAFAGRFTRRYSAEDFTAALSRFGDRYEERITEEVDLIVVGDDFREDPNYIRARQLGIRTITERAFIDYLGLPN